MVRCVVASFRSWLLARLFFFEPDAPPTELHPLSLHDALPISSSQAASTSARASTSVKVWISAKASILARGDRKSTRLNSSHLGISYAVFCLKKKNKKLETGKQRSGPPPLARYRQLCHPKATAR